MLKEQLLDFAVTAISRVYETKERIKNNLKSEAVQNYLQGFKSTVFLVLENQWSKFARSEQECRPNKNSPSRMDVSKNGLKRASHNILKKERKSSIKPAKEISSKKAEAILEMLKNDSSRLVKKNEAVDGKKSLAYLVWALGHAERAKILEGISVHDVSALLYQACKIELYPINVSRVVFGNGILIKQIGQEKRTKTYLLTQDGQTLFKEKFL